MHVDTRPRAWPTVTVAAVVFAVVAAAGLLIVAFPGWSAAEIHVVAAVHGFRNPVFDVVALTINTVFGTRGGVLVLLIVLALIWRSSGAWRVPLRFGLVFGVAWVCAETLKYVVQRPRPDTALLTPLIVPEPITFSYPSGHTAFATALSCAVILVIAHRGRRSGVIAAGVVVALLTAWSRVYLGVHYPTDVIASMVLVPPIAITMYRLTYRRALFASVAERADWMEDPDA